MEVLQVGDVLHHLLLIGAQCLVSALTSFELNDEENAVDDQSAVDTAVNSRNSILKEDIRIVVLSKLLQRGLQCTDLRQPCVARLCSGVILLIGEYSAKDLLVRCDEEPLDIVIVLSNLHIPSVLVKIVNSNERTRDHIEKQPLLKFHLCSSGFSGMM